MGEVLRTMKKAEKRGVKFMNFMEDYKRMAKQEGKRVFSFVPDTMALTPEEMTEELLKFAKDNSMYIVITKECMYPEFELDGLEYTAERVFGRLGAVIWCYMRNQEDGEVTDIPEETRKKMKLIHKLAAPAIALLLVLFFWAGRQFEPSALLAGMVLVVPGWVMLSFYKNLR